MATMDEMKRALGNMFFKDLARFDSGAKGVVVGDNLRVYDKDGSFELRFLNGTPPSMRKPVTDRLDVAKIAYDLGPDYSL